MTYFQPGQRVEYQHMSDARIYRGTLVKYLCPDKYYTLIEEHGKQWLVRRERLRGVGQLPRYGKAA